MEQSSSYWNIYPEYHPKHRLLKYSKCSKIPRDTLRKLSQLRKIYHKLPPIIYSLQDQNDNESINFQKKHQNKSIVSFSFSRYYT